MNIVIRADASIQIGSGHIMRCLTLANELKNRGVRVYFICRELAGHLCDLIESQGFKVFRIAYKESFSEMNDAERTYQILTKEMLIIDWLIVDHYQLGERWERQFRSVSTKIWVIDDFTDRKHDCDVLLNQNLVEDKELLYHDLVPTNCRKLIGPTYTLLRPEFRRERENHFIRNGQVNRIFIFFGSSDPTNETMKTLQALKKLYLQNTLIDVVTGEFNQNKELVKQMCAEMEHVAYYCQIDFMAELMNKSDLAIGSVGTTTWERACLGLPTITIVIAKNQEEVAKTMAKAGAIHNLGWYEDVTLDNLCEAVQVMLDDPERVRKMSTLALQVMNSSSRESIYTFIDEIVGENHYVEY